jgi:flagellar hook-length control protein FliK
MDRELPGQIVQAIRLQVADGGGDAVVRLQPHLLGELVVSIRVSEGVVTAALQSDTPAVRQWIETHEASLRASLADHGLQLDRLVVTGAPRSDDGEETSAREGRERDQAEEEQRRARRNKQRTGNQATFEVFA